MDNVTHSLIGFTIAEAASQLYGQLDGKKNERQFTAFRRAAWFVGGLASNLPDFDFAYAQITRGRLGYLLHHRGHTHTLLAALPLAALVIGLLWLFSRTQKIRWSERDWKWLSGISLLSAALHIFADSWNSYGVHPFWPFDNHWYYGDMIFILEPWLWIALTPPLIYAAKTKIAKATLSIFLAGILAACWITGFVPSMLALTATLTTAILLLALSRLAPRKRISLGLGAWLLVLLTFYATSRQAKNEVENEILSQRKENRIHDTILTPMPANPFCWWFITVESSSQDYVLRRGVWALKPGLYAAKDCPLIRPILTDTTAALDEADFADSAKVLWGGSFRAPAQELQKLQHTHCGVAALLRFTRAPFWMRDKGDGLIVGDLRFDREKGKSFSEIEFEKTPSTCPAHVPSWIEPRADFLKPSL